MVSYAMGDNNNAFSHAGLENVQPGTKPNNMVPVKVIGDITTPVPHAPASMTNHPVILNADGTEWGKPQVQSQQLMVMNPKTGQMMMVTPVGMNTPNPTIEQKPEKPVIFTSPKTGMDLPHPIEQAMKDNNNNNNLPIPMPTSGAMTYAANFPREVKMEFAKLLRLLRNARSNKNHSDELTYITAIRQMVHQLETACVMSKTVARVKNTIHHLTKDDQINHVSNKVDKALKQANKAALSAKKAIKKAVKIAEKKAKKATKNAAKAINKAADATKNEISMKDAINEDKNNEPKVSSLKIPTNSYDERVAKQEKELADLKANVQAHSKEILSLQTKTEAMDEAIIKINEQISSVTNRFNTLSEKERKLTIATKKAIKSLSDKVKKTLY